MRVKESKIWLLVLIPTIAICLIIFFVIQSSKDEERERQDKIDECNAFVSNVYLKDWENACSLIGKPADCSLPTFTADKLNKSFQDGLDRCIVRYSK